MHIYCYRYVPKPGDVVVDLGAGVGQEAFALGRLVAPNGVVLYGTRGDLPVRSRLEVFDVACPGSHPARDQSWIADNYRP